MKTDSKKWRDVAPGSTVLLRGKPWTLESVEKVDDGLAVAVRYRKDVARTTVGKKAVVDVVRSTPLGFEDLDQGERAAASRLNEDVVRRAAARKVKPTTPKAEPSGWYEAPKGDKAEELIREKLGGVLTGVQLAADEAYLVPMMDPSTIAGHLYLFHGVGPLDVRKEGGYAFARELHNAEHREGAAEPKVPHFHDLDRPAIVVGPRFR